jgi:hypothetical protein
MYTQSPKPQSVKEVRKAALKAKNIGAQPDSDKKVHFDVYLKNKNEHWLFCHETANMQACSR